MAEFKIAVAKTIHNEGGDKYTDIPDDKGGPTKYGISLKFYRTICALGSDKVLHPNATADDIKNLTLDVAEWIYLNCFWNPNRYGQINDQDVANKVFDMSVLIGPHHANIMLQQSCNADLDPDDDDGHTICDGIIGPNSIRDINTIYDVKSKYGIPKRWYVYEYNLILVKYFKDICNKDRSQSKFLLGWLNRVLS